MMKFSITEYVLTARITNGDKVIVHQHAAITLVCLTTGAATLIWSNPSHKYVPNIDYVILYMHVYIEKINCPLSSRDDY